MEKECSGGRLPELFFVAEKLVPTISVAQINKKTGKKEKVQVLKNALK